MKKREKILVVITASFPYGNGESFLETEINYWQGWHKIVIVPLIMESDKPRKPLRKINKNDSVIICPTITNSDVLMAIIRCLFFGDFIKEVFLLVKKKQLSYINLIRLLKTTIKAVAAEKKVARILKGESIEDRMVVFYSYWLHCPAILAVRLKRLFKGIAISRCHGYDLYEYRSGGYLPYRNYLLKNLDKVFPISSDGENYLSEKYPLFKSKLLLSRLGTRGFEKVNYERHDIFRIVSCSNIIPVKRVHLIIDALSKVNFPVEWIHFGAGELLEKLNAQTVNLPKNITSILKGAVPNKDILSFYGATSVDLFINVSESEGIPVSIMEAQSFGIPVIATDVGGTSELIKHNTNGVLLPADFTIDQLVNAIDFFYHISIQEYDRFRKNAYNLWKENYNAEANYKYFNEVLLNL